MRALARDSYGDMVKGVVDIESGWVALGGELHADAEEVLLNTDSRQSDLWGFNLYPDQTGDNRIQYTSFINIRPRDGNTSIEVQDSQLQTKIKSIVFSKLGWVSGGG